MAREHVIITGTGRAGTSFLVQLLTHLGLDTGFTPGTLRLDEVAHAGLEIRRLPADAPYIVKSPWYCDNMESILADSSATIKHVIIPVRNFDAAAASRIRVQEERTGSQDGAVIVAGGLWRTDKASDQPTVCRLKFSGLLEILVRHDVPFTLLWYPRLAREPSYLHGKLSGILPLPAFETFEAVFAQVVRPDWMSRFNEADC